MRALLLQITLFISILNGCTPQTKPKYPYRDSPIEGVWRYRDEIISDSFYLLSDGRYVNLGTYIEEDGKEYLNYELHGTFSFSGDTLYLDNKRSYRVEIHDSILIINAGREYKKSTPPLHD